MVLTIHKEFNWKVELAFRKFDLDRDRFLSWDEFRQVLNSCFIIRISPISHSDFSFYFLWFLILISLLGRIQDFMYIFFTLGHFFGIFGPGRPGVSPGTKVAFHTWSGFGVFFSFWFLISYFSFWFLWFWVLLWDGFRQVPFHACCFFAVLSFWHWHWHFLLFYHSDKRSVEDWNAKTGLSLKFYHFIRTISYEIYITPCHI